ADARGPRVRCVADGPRRRARQVRRLDRAAGDGHQSPADRFRVRAIQLIEGRAVDMAVSVATIKQHLIDPEICIRCNTCEATCPIDAVTHDNNNYVVDASICNYCMDCISPCPTGAIDNWRVVNRAYSLEEQFSWEELPVQEDVATPEASDAVDTLGEQVAAILAESHQGVGGKATAPASPTKPTP